MGDFGEAAKVRSNTNTKSHAAVSVALSLGEDEWDEVTRLLELDPISLGALAITCRDGRDAARRAMHSADLSRLPQAMKFNDIETEFGINVSRKDLDRFVCAQLTRKTSNGSPLFGTGRLLKVLVAEEGWSAVSVLMAKAREHDEQLDLLATEIANSPHSPTQWFLT